MRNRIKQMSLLLLLFAVLLAFVGCGETPSDTTLTGTERSGEFVVTGEKYAYRNKDVLLLYVENQTEKNYDVTAVVHYFDAEGNEIKSQKKTFDGWASGYQNYFLFQPNVTFETFTYGVELEEVDGEECNAQYILATFNGLEKINKPVRERYKEGDYTNYPTIAASFKVKNRSESVLYFSGLRVVFDNESNVYIIDSAPQSIAPKGDNYQDVRLYYDLTPEDFAWPEKLVGDIKGVYVITRAWQ